MARHRHQVSLENILDFSPPLSLSPQQRSNASRRFYQITNHFDINEEIPPGWGVSCNRPRLIKLIYEYALSEESKDLLLRAFFQALRLNLDDVEDVIIEGREDELRLDVIGFAEYLMDNFFLPRILFLVEVFVVLGLMVKLQSRLRPKRHPSLHQYVIRRFLWSREITKNIKPRPLVSPHYEALHSYVIVTDV